MSEQAGAHVTTAIRVMLVDDHHVTLWGLEQLVKSSPLAMTVVGSSSTASALLDHPALASADVVVLDLGLTERNSLDLVQRLDREHRVKVVVLTGSNDPVHHREAVRRGARAIVLKSEPAQRVLEAIEAVHQGHVQIARELVDELLRASARSTQKPEAGQASSLESRIASLTPKERKVIATVVQHRSAKALVAAQALGISEHTLRNHLTTIYGKLGLHGKIDLYAFALEHGLAQALRRTNDSEA